MNKKRSFRAAVDELIDIGRQQLIIENKIRSLRAYGVVDTHDAFLAVKEAQAAAARMARNFAQVAYVLERMEDAEYEEEKSNGTA